MLHVIRVVHTSFACGRMNTTMKEPPAHSARPRHVRLTELFGQDVLEQAAAWLLISFTLCHLEVGPRYFSPVLFSRAAVCHGNMSWTHRSDTISHSARMSFELSPQWPAMWERFSFFFFSKNKWLSFIEQPPVLTANNLNLVELLITWRVNLGSIQDASRPSWCTWTNSD